METGREHEVEAAFVRWLESNGWKVRTQVDFADVVAERGDERIVAEPKGITTSAGTDLDTLYGQLLRRVELEPEVRYASDQHGNRRCDYTYRQRSRNAHASRTLRPSSQFPGPRAATSRPVTEEGLRLGATRRVATRVGPCPKRRPRLP